MRQVEYHFYEVDDDTSGDPYKLWITEKYKELMSYFLQAYEEGRGKRLSDFMTYLENNDLASIYEHRYFYDFWIVLHQRSPITNETGDEEDNNTIFGEAFGLLGSRTLKVIENIVHHSKSRPLFDQ